jgi:HD-GYP domain-containing protein (c-di-GMP phosphodiesterase class II)
VCSVYFDHKIYNIKNNLFVLNNILLFVLNFSENCYNKNNKRFILEMIKLHRTKVVGSTLKNDIYDEYGVLLIKKNKVLSDTKYNQILNRNIFIESKDVKSNKEEKKILVGKKIVVEKMMLDSSKQMKDIFESTKITNKLPINDIRKTIIPLIFELSTQNNLFELFNDLSDRDDYTYIHNIGVASLSIIIGRWLNLSENDLSSLSFAALLHDIGKIKIPIDLLNKPGKLTIEEYEIVKKHTIYGYHILSNTIGVSQRIALVALQHHERINGSGYPLGILENKIDYFSKIIAIADVIHAMSSKRPYKESSSIYQVLCEIHRGMFGHFDPNIIFNIFKNFSNLITGSIVKLSDNRYGKIIMIDAQNITSVLIQVENEIFNLKDYSNLTFHIIN